jgi:tetratricopeptide (TPR) repeat protein
MRVCLDAHITQNGGTLPAEETVRRSGWEEIGSLNIACPFVYIFESLTYRAQGNDAQADAAWEKAKQNPSVEGFPIADAVDLGEESLEYLLAARGKVTAFEDKLYGVYMPVFSGYARDPKGWDDWYLCSLGTAVLAANDKDYSGALKHFKAALSADPFDGGNFAACALMSLYNENADDLQMYVREGLKIAPEHKGLNDLADKMLQAAEDAR